MAASIGIAVRNWKISKIVHAFSRSKITIPARMKNGWISKAGTYFGNILSDYKGATVDIFTDAQASPVKAAIYTATLGFVAVAWWNNPDEKSYDKSLLDAANDLVLLSNLTRNPKSDEHLRTRLRLRNEDQIRRMNLVVCSVMWRDNYGKSLTLYDAQCEHLKPGWRNFDERILDVGFMNRWYLLDRAMVDYDVNDDEF